MEKTDLAVRAAARRDLGDITALYNRFVEHTTVNFDIDPFTVEAREGWFGQFAPTGRRRLFVAEAGGRFAGYAGSLRHKEKKAYETTVEATIYVDPGLARRGVGAALYTALFAALETEDVRSIVAGIALPNEPSLAFHRSFGFSEIGVFHEVGRKFGAYHDVLWMERRNARPPG